VALLQPVLEKGIKPDVVAGLSLGEYSAHVAAGTMTFRDAVALVRKEVNSCKRRCRLEWVPWRYNRA